MYAPHSWNTHCLLIQRNWNPRVAHSLSRPPLPPLLKRRRGEMFPSRTTSRSASPFPLGVSDCLTLWLWWDSRRALLCCLCSERVDDALRSAEVRRPVCDCLLLGVAFPFVSTANSTLRLRDEHDASVGRKASTNTNTFFRDFS